MMWNGHSTSLFNTFSLTYLFDSIPSLSIFHSTKFALINTNTSFCDDHHGMLCYLSTTILVLPLVLALVLALVLVLSTSCWIHCSALCKVYTLPPPVHTLILYLVCNPLHDIRPPLPISLPPLTHLHPTSHPPFQSFSPFFSSQRPCRGHQASRYRQWENVTHRRWACFEMSLSHRFWRRTVESWISWTFSHPAGSHPH